ncbi:MAG: calcium-translocating P-type ATPase, PMCA-type [Planctomycetaceae bacterium]
MHAHPWSLSPDDAAADLQTDPRAGLTAAEAAKRLAEFGPNEFQEEKGTHPLFLFFRQFANVMIALLAVAGVVSALLGDWTDAVLILVIVLANAIIGFIQEWRAEESITALRKMTHPVSRVWRDGQITELKVGDLVPGDVIELAGGDLVPADARLYSLTSLECDEAALTGESAPIEKDIAVQPAETVLPDRTSMVFSGTAVLRGKARALITATGMKTELGRIAALLERAEVALTPLQKRLSELSRQLAVIVLAVCLVIFVVGILREPSSAWTKELFSNMLLVAVSLAVAAIPEGLPAVITITLALGSQKMAARKAIIRRLAAVETLGSVDIICTDKTGTLTQNRMSVAELIPTHDGDENVQYLLIAGALCNDTQKSAEGEWIGSATETAIIRAGEERGLDIADLRDKYPRLDEIPFSSDRKRMAVLCRSDGGNRVIVKGASEAIFSRCRQLREESACIDMDEALRKTWDQKLVELSSRGFRVLAIAERQWPADTLGVIAGDPEEQLCLLGLVAIIDPPRPEAKVSIAECQTAGIRPVMITGDHQITASAIAKELGLWNEKHDVLTGTQLEQMTDDQLREAVPNVSVFARVSPEHKLRIVQAYQSQGHNAAMTGDGVNDAPALKQASIGVAMGITGTDVAKGAADMVLADDNFATIVAAIEEGRIVYDNIRKFVGYLLTANMGEILAIVVAILAGFPVPLLPIHLLWINLVTDGLPALALGFERGEPDLMKRKPRRHTDSLFADGMGKRILLYGAWMGLSSIILYKLILLNMWPFIETRAEEDLIPYAQTMVFLVMAVSQLFYVMALRSSSQTLWRLGLFSNWRLTAAVALGAALQLAILYVPLLQKIFHTRPLSLRDLAIGILVAATSFVFAEFVKVVRPQKPAQG